MHVSSSHITLFIGFKALPEADGGGLSSAINIEIISPPKQHAATEKWVIFSDLHVKISSVDTCENVLETVHNEALARKAGVIHTKNNFFTNSL